MMLFTIVVIVQRAFRIFFRHVFIACLVIYCYGHARFRCQSKPVFTFKYLDINLITNISISLFLIQVNTMFAPEILFLVRLSCRVVRKLTAKADNQ